MQNSNIQNLNCYLMFSSWVIFNCTVNTKRASWCQADPPQNCHLNVKKLPKTCLFFKLPKIIIFFKTIANGNFCEKMIIFGKFFFKCQVFGNFLTFNWQFSGGSGWGKIIFLIKSTYSIKHQWLFTLCVPVFKKKLCIYYLTDLCLCT